MYVVPRLLPRFLVPDAGLHPVQSGTGPNSLGHLNGRLTKPPQLGGASVSLLPLFSLCEFVCLSGKEQEGARILNFTLDPLPL